MILVYISMEGRLSSQRRTALREENEIVVEQTAVNVENYVQQVMKLSDAVYYGGIKNVELTSNEPERAAILLADSRKDLIDNIAVFSSTGEVLVTAPAARLQEGLMLRYEDWFMETLRNTAVMRFSDPHVQTIFENSDNSYRWVITFTRAVELLREGSPAQGVLLLDLSYSGLSRLFEEMQTREDSYLYLIDRQGNLLYHPKQQLIQSGLVTENIKAIASEKDGSYVIDDNGDRMASVKTIGYTGWRVVAISARLDSYNNDLKSQLFMVFILGSMLFLLTLINYIITSRLSSPIRELEKSIQQLESGDLDAEVYVGGSLETQQLGISISKMAARIRELMADIVAEHEAKRKSDFDALQSQINPHFLYNTLEIIVWMIENEQKKEAVRVVTALGRFFRISLSRGKNIIPVADEIEHVRNYLLIQQRRFKDCFEFRIEVEPGVESLAAMKLTLQPLAENAIYHGMEYMDGEGEIVVRAYKKGQELYFEVEDNGPGMTETMVHNLLYGAESVQPSNSKGSGIGARNVNERIKIYFGEEYGMEILSEPDEGTLVRLRLPAVPVDEVKEVQR